MLTPPVRSSLLLLLRHLASVELGVEMLAALNNTLQSPEINELLIHKHISRGLLAVHCAVNRLQL